MGEHKEAMNWLCHDGREHDVFREVVTEEIAGCVLASKIEDATGERLASAKAAFESGQKCPHEFVWDECGYMYDFRECAICGKGRGTV